MAFFVSISRLLAAPCFIHSAKSLTLIVQYVKTQKALFLFLLFVDILFDEMSACMYVC